MGVGAAHAEGAHPGPPGPGRPGPGLAVGDDADAVAGAGQLRVGGGEVEGGGDLLVAQGQGGLDQAGDAGGAVEVAEVGLGRADAQPHALGVEDLLDRGDLGGVPEGGAGAVGLQVVEVGGFEPGGGEGLGDDGGLSGDAGGGEPDLVGAVVVDRPAPDDGVDAVAVGERVLQPAQRDDADAAADGGSGGGGVEGPAAAVPGGHARLLVEVADPVGQGDGDAAGQDEVRLAGEEGGAAEGHRDQRGGAVALHRVGGSGEAEGVGDAGGQRVLVVGQSHLDLPEQFQQVGVAEQVVGQVGAQRGPAHDADGAVEPGRVDAGVLQGVPGALQEQPLLRVQQLGLPGRVAEEPGVEEVDVVEHGPGAHVVGVGELVGGHPGGAQLLVGEPGDGLDTGPQVRPQSADVRGAGEPAGHPDEGDVRSGVARLACAFGHG